LSPSPFHNNATEPRNTTPGSILSGLSDLQLNSPSRSSTPNPAIHHESRSPTRSPRVGSGLRANREQHHQVEKEEPPDSMFHKREVQESLENAKNITSRLLRALSSRDLHREEGSTIQSLYQQAKTLFEFKLSASRTVGLVGDSGVGKSSLINSLLDREHLAREVCYCSQWLV
jgi:ABC-type glutathione transport system ATPase component